MVKESESIIEKKESKLKRWLGLGRVIGAAAIKNHDVVDAWKQEMIAKGINPTDALIDMMAKVSKNAAVPKLKQEQGKDAQQSVDMAGAMVQMANSIAELATNFTQQSITKEKEHLEQTNRLVEYVKSLKIKEANEILGIDATKKIKK